MPLVRVLTAQGYFAKPTWLRCSLTDRPAPGRCVWRITDFPRISNSPHTTESAGNNRDDGSLDELRHTGDIKAVILKTLDFSLISEFSVAHPSGCAMQV